MNTENQNPELEVVVKGKLIAIIDQEKSAREAFDVINHDDSHDWLFVTASGKLTYKHDIYRLPSKEFPITVIFSKVIIK